MKIESKTVNVEVKTVVKEPRFTISDLTQAELDYLFNLVGCTTRAYDDAAGLSTNNCIYLKLEAYGKRNPKVADAWQLVHNY